MQIDRRIRFYSDTLARCISDRNASILVVGGGETDRDVFAELGFVNVTISNVDERTPPTRFAPFAWSLQDAESLTAADGSYEYVVVHAALHHCRSPHRALLEMYRVASEAVLCFENRDGAVMRFCQLVGITQTYEHAAVFFNDGRFGGVANTEIPNYVYRWTEREVQKTIWSYDPISRPSFAFFYGYDAPCAPALERASTKRAILALVNPLYRLFVSVFPKQRNLFAFYVKKGTASGPLHPWLTRSERGVTFNNEWAARRYGSNKAG